MESSKEAVACLLFPAKCLALFPYFFRNGHYSLSIPGTIYSAVVVLLCSTVLFYEFTITLPVKQISFVSNAIHYLDSVVMFCLPVLALAEQWKRINAFTECIATIELVETLIADKKIVFPNIFFKRSSIVNCLLVVALAFLTFLDVFETRTDAQVFLIVQAVYYCFLYIQMAVVSWKFCEMVCLCSKLFEVCSKEMELVRKSPKFQTTKLVTLVSGHQRLSFACNSLADIHKFQILLVLLISFIICVTEAYETFTAFFNKTNLDVIKFLLKSTWISACLFLCSSISGTCADCTEKAAEFNLLLYQIMSKDKTYEFANNSKLRLHLSMKREVVFTACGLFTIDYTLIHSMVAAATTYLVILIQFGQPSSSTPQSPNNTCSS